MKLHRLTIHNIASIADAEIDFSGDVLGSEPLFIIHGDTGSGKSTILDTICLALYNSTPRLNRRSSTKYEAGTGNEISITNTCNLLRRHTKEGSVTLDFDGNDGVRYTATWSARTKRNGTLSDKVKRSLSWNGTTLDKEKEIQDQIAKAVGLTHDEFCRTSMLAQGEFTKFLKSDDKERSIILEKLTKSEIYSDIGEKIHDISVKKANHCKALKEALDSTRLPSDDEEKAMAESLDNAQAQKQKLSAEAKLLQSRIAWIDSMAKATADRGKAEAEIAKISEAMAGDEFVARQALVRDWDASAVARNSLAQIEAGRRQLQEAESNVAALAASYAKLRAGVAWLNAEAQREAARSKQLTDWVQQMEPRKPMLQQVQTIAERLNGCITLNEQNTRAQAQIERNKASLARLEADAKSVNADKVKTEETAKAITAEMEKLRHDYDGMHPDALEKAKNALLERISRLEKAQSKLDMASKQREVEDRARKQVAEWASKKDECEKREAELKGKSKTAEEAYNEANERYQRASMSLNDSIKEVRGQLKMGDHCPVCGKIVDQVLTDAAFESALTPLKQLTDDARKAFTDAKANYQTNANSIRQFATELAKAEAELKQQSALTCKADAELSKLSHELGIEGGLTAEIIASETLKAKNEKAQTEESIKQARTLRQSIDHKQTDLNAVNKKASEAAALLSQLATQKATTVANINNDTAAIGRNEKTISDNMLWADGVITTDGWRDKWLAAPKEFMAKIEADANALKAKEQELDQAQKHLHDIENESQNVLTAINGIAATAAKWPDVANPAPAKVTGITGKASEMLRTATEWNSTVESTQKAIKEQESSIDAFCRDNAHITRERLNQLRATEAATVEANRKSIETMQQQREQLNGALKSADKEIKRLNGTKPALESTDTAQSLKQALADATEATDRLNQEIGRLKEQLAGIAETKKKHTEKISELKEAEAESQKWLALDQHIGGTKLRTIAQSFILRSILNRANHYMKEFTDRYRLTCETSSLTILVEDNYNNGMRSSANSLSGGEGFMASLSLALALAQLQSTEFMVDTLFIDEGFGTLDDKCLDSVVSTLERLHTIGGRKVGIISHMRSLSDRIHAQVQVHRCPSDPTCSTVTVLTT